NGAMTEARTLSIWTVYDHPRDYPQHYVARRSEIGVPSVVTNDMFVAATLAAAARSAPSPAVRERRPRHCRSVVMSKRKQAQEIADRAADPYFAALDAWKKDGGPRPVRRPDGLPTRADMQWMTAA